MNVSTYLLRTCTNVSACSHTCFVRLFVCMRVHTNVHVCKYVGIYVRVCLSVRVDTCVCIQHNQHTSSLTCTCILAGAGTLVSTVDGLETLLSLSSLKLEENLPAATKWCRDEGVESVKDLMEEDYADRLAKALQLKQIESSKLITAIKSWGCAAV